MPSYPEILLEAAKDCGYSEQRLRRLRVRLLLDTWVVGPLMVLATVVGIGLWFYAFTLLALVG